MKPSVMKGGSMRKDIFSAAIGLMLFLAGLPLQSYAQENAGYTFLPGASGRMVCQGRWVPSTDSALPGNCEGQLMDLGQFSAVSAKLSADRLDQAINVLVSIDQKLSVNNNELQGLVAATASLQKSIDSQLTQGSLSEVIAKRFDSLPEEVLSNALFKQEIAKLKEDILKEVERRYSTKPSATAK
jgi:hypothetical protein